MEVFFELLMYVFGDLLAAILASIFDGRRPTTRGQHALRLVGFVIIGLIAGGLSVEFHPTHVLDSVTAQHAWLVVSPLVAATCVFFLHLVVYPREPRGWPMLHAAALAATFTTWRFFALAP